MSMSTTQIASTNGIAHNTIHNEKLLEKVMLGNDLSGLSSLEKVQYIKDICHTLGLNPLTQPIKIMKFQGKETPYFSKDSTEQLRKINNVSINNIDTKIIEGGIYVVTAYAVTPDGRQDSSTGVVSIEGLKGDSLGNAMMKAETKAKRRVTLSICGLGFIDESEVDSIPNAQKIEIKQAIDIFDVKDSVFEMSQCTSLEKLQEVYKKSYKYFSSIKNDSAIKKLIEAKDMNKSIIEQDLKFSTNQDLNNNESKEINQDTGEIE
jgi:hypothetical protein